MNLACLSDNLSPRRGFTLVEVLLATLLLALLMTGILAVITDLGATRVALEPPRRESAGPSGPETQALESWARLLQSDLLHARTVDTSRENRLAFAGYAAAAAAPSELHRPVQIVYAIETINRRACLIRRQTLLDVASSDNVRRELVCCGIARFTLTRVSAPARSTLPASPQPAHTGSSQWLLRVWGQSPDHPPFERILSLQTGGAP